tara:strand:+ start:723 stop:1889 length:1167 start_codon:yes stop_codon:yes gene_type:complete
MKILVIGTGMYVSGRYTKDYGTIFPSIIEFQREQKIKKLEVIFSGRNLSNLRASKKKILKAMKISGVKIKTFFYSKNNNYKNILKKEKNLSCVIIAVPDHLHFKVINDCLNYKLNVLVVKPFTTKLIDAKKLTLKNKSNKTEGFIEFHKRFDKHNLLLKDAYEKEKFGKPLYFNVEYSQRKIIPEKIFRGWSDKTNILQYLGVHYIDLVHFITKAKPTRVLAMGQKNWLVKKRINTYDSIQCFIEWKTKENIFFNQTLVVNWVDPNNTSSMSYQKIKFCGTKGNYESDQKTRGIKIISDNDDFEEPNPDFCQMFSIGNGQIQWKGYGIKSVLNFLKGIYLKKIKKIKSSKAFHENSANFQDGLISTAVVEGAKKSLDNKSNWQKIHLK